MNPPSPEQITWLKQSVAETGNSEHQILLYLLRNVADLWMEAGKAAFADGKMHERLAALEDASRSQPAELPADTQPQLVDLMDQAYTHGNGTYAEIHAVADWLEKRGYGSAAASLRQEADR